MSPAARIMVEIGPLLNIGWVFAFGIGALAALGWWLDRKLGTGRLCLIAGALLGIAVGFANLYKVVLQLDQRKGKR